MNVYDFDGTIYYGDSTVDFYLYCLKKHPGIIRAIRKQIKGMILYKAGMINKTMMKEDFFSFLLYVPNIESSVNEFWDSHEKKIMGWYLKQKKIDDIIISASPEFLLKEICHRLEIKHLIASRVDKKSGKFRDENCYGEKKLQELRKQIQLTEVDTFYSDSYSDQPLADIAKRAIYIHKGVMKNWDKEC